MLKAAIATLLFLLLSLFSCRNPFESVEELPTLYPSVSNVMVPADWLPYTDALYGYSVSYPQNWIVNDQNGEKTKIFVAANCMGVCPLFWYVSVIPENMLIKDYSVYNYLPSSTYEQILATPVGSEMLIEVIANLPELEPFNTFIRLPDVTVDQQTGLVIENYTVWESSPETRDRRVFTKYENQLYVLGVYYESQPELDAFNQFVASFRFAGE